MNENNTLLPEKIKAESFQITEEQSELGTYIVIGIMIIFKTYKENFDMVPERWTRYVI